MVGSSTSTTGRTAAEVGRIEHEHEHEHEHEENRLAATSDDAAPGEHRDSGNFVA
jgi:hypothetical protein